MDDAQNKENWDSYRRWVVSSLENIERGQVDMNDKIEALLKDYADLRVEMIREAVQAATIRGFWAAGIPAVIAVISMIVNLLNKH